MIVGLGIDVVDIARFERTLARTPRLLTRLFTPLERELPIASLAVRFAAKEAVAKALGAPAGLVWTDAQIRRGPRDRPTLEVTGSVAAAARDIGVHAWHVSLSHDGGVASAVVIAEG